MAGSHLSFTNSAPNFADELSVIHLALMDYSNWINTATTAIQARPI
jgi:hypothetical protein